MNHDMGKARQEEVDRNYEAFVRMLPGLLAQRRGQHALMKNGEILGFYSTPHDASSAAEAFIKDGLYSIQHVTDAAVDLGYFSHAVSLVPL